MGRFDTTLTCHHCAQEFTGDARNSRYCQPCKLLSKRARERAYTIMNKAIYSAQIPWPRTLPCADCGQPASLYDHRDYRQPLLVEPVCRKCNWHRGPAEF